MASFKAKFPVLQELFAKNHRGPLPPPPSGARVKFFFLIFFTFENFQKFEILKLLKYYIPSWESNDM